jgi:hypothetical protein
MNENVIVTLILSLISGVGLLVIIVSFFEKDFEEIEFFEDDDEPSETSDFFD